MIEARQCYNENVIKSGFSANIVVLPSFPRTVASWQLLSSVSQLL